MKHYAYILIFAGLINFQVSAQLNGVYVKAEDYLRNTPLLLSRGSCIKTLFSNPCKVELKFKDTIGSIKGGVVYAFTDKSGKVYRRMGLDLFQMEVGLKELQIYSAYAEATQNKGSEVHYYFSKSFSDTIIALTTKNLHLLYSDKPNFIFLLDERADELSQQACTKEKDIYLINKLWRLSESLPIK